MRSSPEALMSHDPQLGPLRTLDLFRNAVVLYRRTIRLVTLIVMIPLLPFTIVHLLILTAPTTQQLVSVVQNSFIALFVDAVLITAASQVYTNQQASLRSGYHRAGRRFGVLFAALTLQGLLLLIPGGILWSVLRQPPVAFNDVIRISVPVILLGIPFLFCIVRFYLVTAIAVLERHDPGMTLRQSWRFTRHAFWRTLLVILVSGLVSILIMALPAAITSILLSNRTSTTAQWSYAISTTILSQLSLLVVWPIQSILRTVLYHDLQVRVLHMPQTNTLPSDAIS
jgi:hypothetical protein